MHLLLGSPYDLLINVTKVLLLCSSNKAFMLTIFLASNYLANMVGFILLHLKRSISFSLNLLGTGLLYLLDIMMNSSFMPVHHLVCHLDLN